MKTFMVTVFSPEEGSADTYEVQAESEAGAIEAFEEGDCDHVQSDVYCGGDSDYVVEEG